MVPAWTLQNFTPVVGPDVHVSTAVGSCYKATGVSSSGTANENSGTIWSARSWAVYGYRSASSAVSGRLCQGVPPPMAPRRLYNTSSDYRSCSGPSRPPGTHGRPCRRTGQADPDLPCRNRRRAEGKHVVSGSLPYQYPRYAEAVKFNTYWLEQSSNFWDRFTKYLVQRHTKVMAQMMKPYTFTEREPISMLSFFSQYRSSCDFHEVRKGAALWMIPHLLSGEPKDTLEDYIDAVRYDAAAPASIPSV